MKVTSRWRIFLVLLTALSAPVQLQAQTGTRDQSHSSVTYEGEWLTIQAAQAYGGSVAASNATGARVTLRFHGSAIFIAGYDCTCGGIARIYLDGQWQDTVDTYAATTARANLHQYTGLADTDHVISIEVTGQRNSASTGNYVAFDSFTYESDNYMEENFSSVAYTGDWIEVKDASVSGGSVRASRDNDASVRVTFTGTGISWIGYRCACAAGTAEIFAPGQVSAIKHTWAPTPQPQAEIYRIEGLPMGNHTLTISPTGQSVGDTAWIVIDAFRVLDNTTGGGPENQAPTVSFTEPANNALVTGIVTLAATAQDNVGVAKVRFYASLSSGLLLLGEDTSPPYSITRDTSAIPSGRNFVLYADAIDAAGNFKRSEPIAVTVQHTDRTRPTVRIVDPQGGDTVSGTINVVAEASDDNGIASIEFWRDDRCCWYPLIGTLSGATTLSTDTRRLLDGSHTLTAIVTDTAGNRSAESAPVTITVDNHVQPGMVRIDEDHADIVYDSNWGGTNSTGSAGPATKFNWGDYASAVAIGSTATLTFEGVGVRWIGFGCDMCGDATVSLDGGPAQPVGLGGEEWGRPGNNARIVYSSPALSNGRHTLTITVVDANAANPNLYPVVIDGFEILK